MLIQQSLQHRRSLPRPLRGSDLLQHLTKAGRVPGWLSHTHTLLRTGFLARQKAKAHQNSSEIVFKLHPQKRGREAQRRKAEEVKKGEKIAGLEFTRVYLTRHIFYPVFIVSEYPMYSSFNTGSGDSAS